MLIIYTIWLRSWPRPSVNSDTNGGGFRCVNQVVWPIKQGFLGVIHVFRLGIPFWTLL